MISIENVSFSYGEKKVLENFSLKIEGDSRICLYGESGCGKTTVLRLLLRLETPQSGIITGAHGKKASAVFQENRLLPFKTIKENLLLISNEKVAEYNLEALGISDTADLYPKDLSGGMARRAAIARALSAEFDFLVLDEPFTGLDEKNIENACKVILSACKTKPIIMVTHSKKEIELLNAVTVELKPIK